MSHLFNDHGHLQSSGIHELCPMCDLAIIHTPLVINTTRVSLRFWTTIPIHALLLSTAYTRHILHTTHIPHHQPGSHHGFTISFSIMLRGGIYLSFFFRSASAREYVSFSLRRALHIVARYTYHNACGGHEPGGKKKPGRGQRRGKERGASQPANT